VAWNANVEAFPVSADNMALGDGAPGGVAEQAAYGVTAPQIPTPTVFNPESMKVKPVPNVDVQAKVPTASVAAKDHVYDEPRLKKPGPPEFMNRDKKPGDRFYAEQMSRKPVYTYNHQMYHIENHLQMKRDLDNRKAVGAFNALQAAKVNSATTAEMAYRARSDEEDKLAASEAKISELRNNIAAVAGNDNEDHAKLQLQLERAKQAHAGILAASAQMAKEVDAAIDKSAQIQGLAKVDYEINMDGTMELSQAIIAAQAAKMQLDQFDKQVAAEKKVSVVDKANKAEFAAADVKSADAVAQVDANAEQAERAAEEADYQADKKQARDAAAKKNKGLVTVASEEAESNHLAAEAAAINVPTPPAPEPADKPAAYSSSAEDTAAFASGAR
jgi:hypothetical protein